VTASESLRADRGPTTRVTVGQRALVHAACLVACLVAFGCSDAPEPLAWADVDQLIQEDYPDVPSITTDELAESLAAGRAVVLLDVREPEEFAVSHLAGARRVTSAAEAISALDTAGPDTLIVAYCSVGYRSAALVIALREQGMASAVNLEGSIFAWANAGLPVYRGDTEVAEVHPFDDAWGTLLNQGLWAFEPTVAIP
jgi:rhodanese-related sulfurtransferase